MARTFLDSINGRNRQQRAIIESAGAADADKLIATGADGRIDETFLPIGIGADIAMIAASETLASGAFVNIFNDAGTAKVRNADATSAGKESDGFVLEGAASGAMATVYFEGRNTSLSGLTVGARYYLSATTPGASTVTPPAASGNVVQCLGRAYSATELAYEGEDGVILAA